MQLPAANVALCLYNCTGLDLVVLRLSSKCSGCTPAGTSEGLGVGLGSTYNLVVDALVVPQQEHQRQHCQQ